MFDYITGKVLGYGLMLNGLALAVISVIVHFDNTIHLVVMTPFGLLVAFFGYKIATTTKVYYDNTPNTKE
jgi:hypothetical protein